MTKARTGKPSFGGPFKTFSVSVSTNREKGTESRLLVYSQGSRTKVVEYLWLKYLWDELSKQEMLLFLTLPETLNSEIKVSALRAVLINGRKVTRTRLNRILIFLKREPYSRERYLGYKRLDVEIHEISRSLPRVPKFSGWVRSSSSVGSKRSNQGPILLEPLAIDRYDYNNETFDWYTFLTVGDPSLLSQWNKIITLTRP